MKKEHKSANKMELDKHETIDYNLCEIKDKLETNEIYKIKDIVWVKRYKENKIKEKDYYIVKYLPNMFTYIGFTDEYFKRNALGINIFSNKDIYIGNWENDYQEGDGLYINRYRNNSVNKTDIYLGEWEKNKKINGLYFWGETNSDYSVDEKNYDLFYGKFKESIYHNGIYISKRFEDQKLRFYLYKGEFIMNNNHLIKHGDNCILFSLDECKLIEGKVFKDNLKSGRVYILNNNDYSIKTVYDCEFDENKNKTIPYKSCPVILNNEQKVVTDKIIQSIKSIIENHDYIYTLNTLLRFEKIRGIEEFEKNMEDIKKFIGKYKHLELKNLS